MAANSPVNVFECLDYREFLRDFCQEKKATEYGFSQRAFSRRAGLRSTNYLKPVMDAGYATAAAWWFDHGKTRIRVRRRTGAKQSPHARRRSCGTLRRTRLEVSL